MNYAILRFRGLQANIDKDGVLVVEIPYDPMQPTPELVAKIQQCWGLNDAQLDDVLRRANEHCLMNVFLDHKED